MYDHVKSAMLTANVKTAKHPLLAKQICVLHPDLLNKYKHNYESSMISNNTKFAGIVLTKEVKVVSLRQFYQTEDGDTTQTIAGRLTPSRNRAGNPAFWLISRIFSRTSRISGFISK